MSQRSGTHGAVRLPRGHIEIALHTLRDGGPAAGSPPPLLLLHSLGSSAAQWPEDLLDAWQGSVYALDFAGHGDSDRIRGGGYSPEYFLADADLALHEIGGTAALAGSGIGAYVALMLAGARVKQVPAALLLPGDGLLGGGPSPQFEGHRFATLDDREAQIDEAAARYLPGSDPMVSLCEVDLRPNDYVEAFAQAGECLLYSTAISQGEVHPSWWEVFLAAEASAPVSPEFSRAVSSLAEACVK